MADEELMTIGRFARLSGVSAHALRHYDEVDLLRPYEVDRGSGYRRYRRDQLPTARLIQALRNLGLSIDNVRRILTAAGDEEVAALLAEHRGRLSRERSHLDVRIRDVDRYLQRGLSMPVLQSGSRPVQIKIAVDDHAAAAAFYQTAFDVGYEVARRTETEERRAIVFGEYGQDSFFLLWLLDDPDRFDRPGVSNFSFLVDDVDAVHRRALAAGATEVVAPREFEGMPRSSTVRDPSGNWIGLAQGWDGFCGCRPVQMKIAVDDLSTAVTFYEQALGLDYRVARRTQHHEDSAFVFGEYEQDDFFLLWLIDDPDRFDRPGPMNFSFLVEDVDATHTRALAARATEAVSPRNLEGMPRSAAIKDPSGNWVGFAQG